MLVSPSRSAAPCGAALRLHKRLQHWRHRERVRHPGLFSSSLAPAVSSPPVILQRLRNGRCQLLISGSPILLCDGCGALLISPDADHAASSASTVAPASGSIESWATCDSCSFATPVGVLRRLLDLPNDRGPAFVAEVAQALLVEALGAPRSCKLNDKLLREWMLDPSCRLAGLDELCGALGLRDEQLEQVTVSNQRDESVAIIEAERFLERTVPKDIIHAIPFSVGQLCTESSNRDFAKGLAEAREASERAKALITEAVRILQKAGLEENLSVAGSSSAILKLRGLGKEYLTERTRTRTYNLSQLKVSQRIQVQEHDSRLSGGGAPCNINES